MICSLECDLRYLELQERVSVIEQMLKINYNNNELERNFQSSLSLTQFMSDADADQRSHGDRESETNAKFITDREQTSEVVMPVDLQGLFNSIFLRSQ